MYVRNKVHMTPPVNYAGVTFSRNDHKNTESDKDTKIHKATPVNEVQATFKTIDRDVLEEIPENDAQDSVNYEEKCEIKDAAQAEEPPKCDPKEAPKGLLSDILGDKFSLEDILLFASLFLLVSGQIDDEILLLAGVLLLFSN